MTDEGSSLNLSMDYILDSNGRLRYLYPSDGRFPAFLRFLNISTFRGKVISLAVRLFFRLKMSFLLKAGSVTVFLHGRNSLLQVALKEHLDNFGFCIFLVRTVLTESSSWRFTINIPAKLIIL